MKKEASASQVESYEVLDVTVCYSFKKGAAHVDFEAYEIIARASENGTEYIIPVYEGLDGCGLDGKETTDITKARKYIHGSVKWDGCSHYYFGNEGYIHLCGSRSIVNLSELVKKIYSRCAEIAGFDYDPLISSSV